MPLENKIQIINQMLPRFNNPQMVKNTTELVEIAIKSNPNRLFQVVLRLNNLPF
jgi:hypothetical protein